MSVSEGRGKNIDCDEFKRRCKTWSISKLKVTCYGKSRLAKQMRYVEIFFGKVATEMWEVGMDDQLFVATKARSAHDRTSKKLPYKISTVKRTIMQVQSVKNNQSLHF